MRSGCRSTCKSGLIGDSLEASVVSWRSRKNKYCETISHLLMKLPWAFWTYWGPLPYIPIPYFDQFYGSVNQITTQLMKRNLNHINILQFVISIQSSPVASQELLFKWEIGRVRALLRTPRGLCCDSHTETFQMLHTVSIASFIPLIIQTIDNCVISPSNRVIPGSLTMTKWIPDSILTIS